VIEIIDDIFAQCANPHKQRFGLLAYINDSFLKRGASNVSGESNAGSEHQPRLTRSIVVVGRDLVGRCVDLAPSLSALKH
jgi:hypothetical protein